MKSEDVRVEYVGIDAVKPAKRNPKKHDVPGIARSIRRHGFAEVLLENAKTGRIVAGHGRLEALQLLRNEDAKNPPKHIRLDANGRWQVPVLRGVRFKNEAEAEAYLLADNRLVEAGGWDRDALAPILADILARGGEISLADAGWTVPDYEAISRPSGSAKSGSSGPGEGAGIRQFVFPFTAEQMPVILNRLAAAMGRLKVDNHTDAVLGLLAHYEAAQ